MAGVIKHTDEELEEIAEAESLGGVFRPLVRCQGCGRRALVQKRGERWLCQWCLDRKPLHEFKDGRVIRSARSLT